MTANGTAWAKKIRHTQPPDRFVPFFCNGKTHRGAHRIEDKGWYFLTINDALAGPFPSRAAAEAEAAPLRQLLTDIVRAIG